MDIAQNLLKNINVKVYKLNDIVFSETDLSDNNMCFILNGQVQIYKKIKGKQEKINTLKKGNFFGEIALVIDLPRTATVKVDKDNTKIAFFNKETFLDLTKNQIQFIIKLFGDSLRRYKNIFDKISTLNKPFKVNMHHPDFLERSITNRAENLTVQEYVNKMHSIFGVKKKKIITEGGPSNNTIFFITNGEISIQKDIDDENHEIYSLKKGDIFGLLSLVENVRTWYYTASVSTEKARVISIDKNMLFKTAQLHPDFLFSAFKTLITYQILFEKAYNNFMIEMAKPEL
jgi:CRP-like cAMP-binding protein